MSSVGTSRVPGVERLSVPNGSTWLRFQNAAELHASAVNSRAAVCICNRCRASGDECFAYNDSCIDLFLLQNGKKKTLHIQLLVHSWEFKSQLYRTEKISKSADSHIKRERLTQLINQQNCCWWIIQTRNTTDPVIHSFVQFWGTFSAAWYFLSVTFWRQVIYFILYVHFTLLLTLQIVIIRVKIWRLNPVIGLAYNRLLSILIWYTYILL